MKRWFIFACLIWLVASPSQGSVAAGADWKLENPPDSLQVDVMAAFRERQSTRAFASREISRRELATILWAADGINRKTGRRTAPTASGKYFIAIYVACGQGIYLYQPEENLLKWISDHNIKAEVGKQPDIQTASHVLILVADLALLPAHGRENQLAMANGTAGTIAENVYLAAAALKVGTRLVASLNPDPIRTELKLAPTQLPLYIMPLGYPKPE